ncbi:MAG: NAD+ synthase, partial [Spirulina sp. DLM2.Bin59]
MKVAIAQLNPTIGDLKGNAAQILAAAEGAIAQGANLLLTPELSLCGYPPRDLLLQPSFIAAMAGQLVELAQALPPTLTTLVGIAQTNSRAQESGQKPLFNAMALLAGGQVQQFFPKRLLPTYDVFDEDRYFEPGDQPNQFTLEGIRFGVTICEDLWNDDQFWGKRQYNINPIADLADLGVNVILNLSASPYRVGIQATREAMLIHASQRFNLPIFYVNQVGGNDDLIFDGRSVAVHGAVCHRSAAFASDLAVVDLSAQPVKLPPLADEPMAEIWQALVLGVRDYARKCGFKSAVLGLSGGIDSALVGAIAAEALGPEQVLGVLMPSPYSSDHSI